MDTYEWTVKEGGPREASYRVTRHANSFVRVERLRVDREDGFEEWDDTDQIEDVGEELLRLAEESAELRAFRAEIAALFGKVGEEDHAALLSRALILVNGNRRRAELAQEVDRMKKQATDNKPLPEECPHEGLGEPMPAAEVIDLMEALKASLAARRAKPSDEEA